MESEIIRHAAARDEVLALGEEWAARQDRESRSLADAEIKRACVAACSTHIRQNCFDVCGRAILRLKCSFFSISFVFFNCSFFHCASPLICVSLFPPLLFASASWFLPVLVPPCFFSSQQSVCSFPPGSEISVSMCMRTSERPVCVL